MNFPIEQQNCLNYFSKKFLYSSESLVSRPYINTIPPSKENKYPGNTELEKKIQVYIRWNAMAMVTRANKENEGIGDHISTYTSISDLWEVGFNHFFRVYENKKADFIYFRDMYHRVYIPGLF